MNVGSFALVAAWLLSLYGLIGGGIGAWKNSSALCRSARNSLLFTAVLSCASLVSLGISFLTHDYTLLYVWQTSNNEMHPLYLVSAIWGGMDGSMLLWAAMLSVFAAAATARRQNISRELKNWSVPVLSASVNFFLFVVAFLSNPFRLIPEGNVPLNGNGLNPLLQNPSMLIHPPLLYLGFTGFVVPFAFCIAALLSGRLSNAWITVTRRWTLLAWGFLTAGIIIGGNWAYIELGWGGFWGWDPVENSSFLPWLVGTAFLHSVMVQQRRGMLKVWNVGLCLLTYSLAIFGTFLTRSGIVQSVHAFADSDIGWVFLVHIACIAAAGTLLLIYRWGELRPENTFESFFSREAVFLFNNLLLLGICFATFWGVMLPVFSEWFTGKKSVVGPPFFNAVNVPLFLALLFFMGVGPLIAWRRSSLKTLIRTFMYPLAAGFVVTGVFLFIDISRVGTAISFGLAVFVAGSVIGEFTRALRAQRQLSAGSSAGLGALVRRRPQRFGGLLVHLGVAVMVVSITASMVYKIEKDFVLRQGESFEVGHFELKLERLVQSTHTGYNSLQAEVSVFDRRDGSALGMLRPERRLYLKRQEPTTEVDIRITAAEDLYLALAGLEMGAASDGAPHDLSSARASFKVFVNPLQIWLWFGSLVVLLGTIAAIGPAIRVEGAVEAKQGSAAGVRI